MQLTIDQRQKLAKALRKLARSYFNRPASVETRYGICAALESHPIRLELSYWWINALMNELWEPGNTFGPYTTCEGWQERAWLCLFLGEYLEETVAALTARQPCFGVMR